MHQVLPPPSNKKDGRIPESANANILLWTYIVNRGMGAKGLLLLFFGGGKGKRRREIPKPRDMVDRKHMG